MYAKIINKFLETLKFNTHLQENFSSLKNLLNPLNKYRLKISSPSKFSKLASPLLPNSSILLQI